MPIPWLDAATAEISVNKAVVLTRCGLGPLSPVEVLALRMAWLLSATFDLLQD